MADLIASQMQTISYDRFHVNNIERVFRKTSEIFIKDFVVSFHFYVVVHLLFGCVFFWHSFESAAGASARNV